ncbi:uncharacterized protein BYT42DRAFT_606287 [Radiomyces spectabilis]|uniref:uncharacterized protein n=1 Tax=Radiomyces spectabilis TaxID=64574 RepID=UPI00222071B8|nr:uncharacterized protein BYT42DRAFT_606287 [Radiomyces spectabilis]KAI8374358.1 hypothetical protein BYT42DRAFT_606287 [Radiomyces spectabilis]
MRVILGHGTSGIAAQFKVTEDFIPQFNCRRPAVCTFFDSFHSSRHRLRFSIYFSFDTPQTSPCSPCLSYERVYSSSQTSQQQPQPCFLLPPPVSTRRCRSLSNASTSSQSSVRTFPSLSSTPPILQQRRLSDPPVFHSDLSSFISSHRPHSTSPSPCLSPRIPESCNAPFVTKRKRGRPPNAQRNVSQRDNWTFVTPTVWDVKRKEEEPPQDNKATIPPESSNHQMMVLMWPTEKHATGDEDDNKLQSSNTSLNTFTNTRMDTTLTMPKKKRGRKPKMQLAGNSCFVWRDLTARRGANRKKAAQKMKSKQPTEDPDIDAAVSIQGLTIADKT